MTEERHYYVPPQGPPQDVLPNPQIFAIMGGVAFFKMLEDFYSELEKSSPIRHLFPQDMREASRRSAAFFVFILGGPPLYQQQFGSPRMRQRHLLLQSMKLHGRSGSIVSNTLFKMLIKILFSHGAHGKLLEFFPDKFSAWDGGIQTIELLQGND